MATQWYRDGLQFSCTQCGDCCTGAPGFVWVTPPEIERLASFLGMTVDRFGERYLRKVGARYSLIEKPNGDCIFYSKACTVYPARPLQCRTFPFWRENLRSRLAWKKAEEGCPGIGRGRLYPVEEIGRIQRGEANAAEC